MRISLFRRCRSARAALLLALVGATSVLRVRFACMPTLVCRFYHHASAVHVVVVDTQVELKDVLDGYISLSSSG